MTTSGHGAVDDRLDDAMPLSPQESLALLTAQRARTERAVDVDPRLLYAAWGTAWLVGFGLIGLALLDGPPVPVPPLVAGLALPVLLLAAFVVTWVHIGRTQRGIDGPGALAGALYGWAWPLAFFGLTLVIEAAVRATGDEALRALLWPALSGVVVGVLYVAGAALWREVHQFVLGAWVLLTSSAGALLGLPGLYWVMSLAGGGGFLAAAAFATVALRRTGGRGRAPAGRA